MSLCSIPLIIISRFNDAHIGFRLLHNITNMILIVKIIPKSGRCDFSHTHIIYKYEKKPFGATIKYLVIGNQLSVKCKNE